MAVRRNYRINLRNYGNPPAIMVSQYDENYDLVFEVYDGVVPATGLNAYTVKLVGRQPGEDPALKYEFTGTVSGIANNILSFTIDTTMTGRAGKGTAEIVILDTTNDVKFASFNLPVYVENAAVPDDAIDADVERAQEIADEVQDIVDTAAETVKGEAESWAVGQRDGEDVPSTDPTYHNNAKYYSEVAQDIADSIGIDATLSISGKAADAKKTGDEISSLKEDLNIKKILTADDFQQGVWSSSSAGAPTTNTTRICTKVLYPVYAGDKIEYTSSTLLMSFGIFSGNVGTVKNMEYHDWNTYATSTVFEISANGFLFINIRKSNNATITPSDYDASITLYQTVGNHADRGAVALAQSLRNLNAINAVSDGSSVISLAMQSGKYINTSGAFVYNNNATLALSGLIPVDEKWITKVSFAVNGSAPSVGYSVNFYNADYTWISGTNNLTISADDFPTGTKYIILMDYDTSSSHNGCAVTFFGFKRIDDLDERVDALESANTVDSTVVNKDVFVDKTVIPNKNINYTTGAAETNNSFAACDFIAVEAETAYHVMRNNNLLSATGNVAFYNASKTYISGQQSTWSDWTTPANCAYVRFSVYYGAYTSESFSFDDVVIVNGTVASALNNLSAITTAQYSPLYGKKWIGIGDSLTEGNARADLRYWNYIVQPYGMTFANMGVGGTGYINRQSESKAFYQRAEVMDTDADIITVMGGVNDCLFATADIGEATDTTTTTWCGCVNALIDTIRGLYAFAPLGIISPLPCDWVDSLNESNYDTQLPTDPTCRMSQFVEKLKEICALRGVPFLDLFHSCGMTPENATFREMFYSCGDARSGDGLHPNSGGHKLFYRKVEKFLETLLAE